MLDRVTLDQLRVFVTIAESGSFSGAARRLGRVQSAISQAARTLEEALGVTLFDRSGHKPELTAAGRVLLEDARIALNSVEAFRQRARDIVEGLEPQLTIVIDGMMPNAVLMQGLKSLKSQFPTLPLTLMTEGEKAAVQYLREGSASLAIFPIHPEVETDEFGRVYLGQILMVPAAAASHPLAQIKGAITPEERLPHTQLRLTTRGIRGPVSGPNEWYFTSQQSRLDFLLEGFGWAFMPHHQIQPYLAKGKVRQLQLKDVPEQLISMYAVHKRDTPPGIAAQWLTSELHAVLAATNLSGR
jgi:DNA-binding transcriptional LysR family regulator